MKVLLDVCTPVQVRKALPGHDWPYIQRNAEAMRPGEYRALSAP